MDTNKHEWKQPDEAVGTSFTGSLNGDPSANPQNRTKNDFIRVNSPFVVCYCMDTA